MNNRITNFFSQRNSKWNLAAGILVLLGLILGCSDSGGGSGTETAKKPTPPGYFGVWTAADGSTITLRSDNTGDYKFGGKSVSGANVEVDETAKEIRFTLLGFDSGKYKIDAAPAGNKMKLDAMEYRRSGGFDTGDMNKTTAEKAEEIPSEDDLRPIVGETLQNFNAAVQKGDFSDFYATLSESWQSQTTVAELDKAFAPLVKEKMDFTPKSGASLTFSPKPAFGEDSVLAVMVNYPTAKNGDNKFRLRYVKEAGNWKLLGIRLNP